MVNIAKHTPLKALPCDLHFGDGKLTESPKMGSIGQQSGKFVAYDASHHRLGDYDSILEAKRAIWRAHELKHQQRRSP